MPSSVLAKCYGTLLSCIVSGEVGKVQCRFKVTVTQAQHCWPDTTQFPQKRTCPKTWPVPVGKRSWQRVGVTLQRTGHSRGIKPRGVGDSRENYKVPQLNNQVGHEGGAAQVPEDRKRKKRQTTRAWDTVE